MSNMVAQAPDNNQGPWANLENYLRTVVGSDRANPAAEMYIVSGPAGAGGSGSNGGTTLTLAHGNVTVPAYTWKVALVLPYGSDDVSRVTCSTRTIAVIMPNMNGIRTNDPNDWMHYLTTVDDVEALTGLDLFSNVPQAIQNCIQAGVNGSNPQAQTISFAPIADHHYGDADFALAATASSGLPVTLTVVTGPATIVGGSVHLTGAGTVTVRASQAGNVDPDNITQTFAKAVPVDRTFAVAKADPVFSSLSSPTIEAGTQATVEGVITAGIVVPTGAVTITAGQATASAAIDAAGHFSATLATESFTAAASPYTISAGFAGDDNFSAAGATSTLKVVDTTAPAIGSVAATPNLVTVPDHRLFGVFVDYSTTDLSGPPTCSLTVASNEPVNGTGDGNTAVDWLVIDAHHVQLRAERAGSGSGRIYTITATCTDAFGNSA